jgi:hypothetical protein
MSKKSYCSHEESYLNLRKMIKQDFGYFIFWIWSFLLGFLIGWILRGFL